MLHCGCVEWNGGAGMEGARSKRFGESCVCNTKVCACKYNVKVCMCVGRGGKQSVSGECVCVW